MNGERKFNYGCNQREAVRNLRKNAREAELCEGAGNHGVRHFGWRAGGDRHRGHHCVQTEAARTVDRYFGRHQQLVGEAGQSTVEFALITAGLLAVVLAFGLLGQKLEAGMFVQHALASASHHLCSLGSIADIFAY